MNNVLAARLEDLPDEILGQICLELPLKVILDSWNDPSSRLDQLIVTLSYSISLSDRNIPADQLSSVSILCVQVDSLVIAYR